MRLFPLLALCALSMAAVAHEVDLTRLPLGDDRISSAPKAGWIWACARADVNEGRGAAVRGPWIRDDGTFDLTAKYVVDGAVNWPHRFEMKVENGVRVFTTNDLPNHPTGVYPIAPSDDAYKVDRNPGHIAAQRMRVELPLEPQLLPDPTCTPGAVGILLTGAVLFNALDAEGRDAVAHETQDACQGHPQRTGTYHYHNVTSCVEDKRGPDGHSALVGYALDGFGIYGRFGEKGQPLGSAQLDACHGHTHVIDWNGARKSMYHYHATPDFPYSVGCMRGAFSHEHVRIISGALPTPEGGRGARPNVAAAAQKLGISVDQLVTALGPPPPDFPAAASRLGITVEQLYQALGRPLDGSPPPWEMGRPPGPPPGHGPPPRGPRE